MCDVEVECITVNYVYHVAPNNISQAFLTGLILPYGYKYCTISHWNLVDSLPKRGSWLDDEATVRTYTTENMEMVVNNQYQEIKCPHCGNLFFGRITCITRKVEGRTAPLETHINHHPSLEHLKHMLITYQGDENLGVFEMKRDDEYVLKVVDKRTLPTHLEKKWPVLMDEELEMFE